MTVEQVALNATQSIPVQLSTQTDWTQYTITLLIGSFAALYVLAMNASRWLDIVRAKIAVWKMKWKTGRDTVVIRHNQSGLFSAQMIDTETEHKVRDALIDADGDDVNIVLQTPGGSVFNAQGIVELIKQYSGRVHCYIPRYAMSGGTLIALACDEIYMAPSSSLGPVDPQLNSWQIQGSARGYQHVIEEKGSDAEDHTHMYEFLARQVERDVKEMVDGLVDSEDALDALTTGRVHHGKRFTPYELSKMGLGVRRMPSDLHRLMSRFIGEASEKPVLTTTSGVTG